ncbi:GNAT family N-acetyltransferase [Rhodococcus jostii]|uniref:GNAT family N-acetyltransferase n=1 Tax=Rhodococcus jostii TaxID=132919 RepID=UPI00363054B7
MVNPVAPKADRGDPARTVDATVDAWWAALGMFATLQQGGSYRRSAHGICELITGAPLPMLNTISGAASDVDAAELAAFGASPALGSLPWSIQVRGEDPAPHIVRTAAEYGLAQRSTSPLMIKVLDEGGLTDTGHAACRVRRVTGTDSDLYLTVMADGYEVPAELFTIFATPAVLDHPAMWGYVAEEDGVAVATSLGILADDHVGVFNIAVPLRHRRKGWYGTAVTTAVLQQAYQAGARTAFLHSSPAGVPLYQSIGFAIAENWTIFHTV